MTRGAARLEGLALLLALSCEQERAGVEPARGSPPAPSLSALLTPSRAGKFRCEGETCVQPYPRLPDTGEWRCRDEEGVVWCAGGEPAAGVVPGSVDPSYHCRQRAGRGPERVCIDRLPDYPAGDADRYDCRFAQEQGIERVCQRRPARASRGLPEAALPACWLDRDCPSGDCVQGVCSCAAPRDCSAGACRDGLCVEAPR